MNLQLKFESREAHGSQIKSSSKARRCTHCSAMDMTWILKIPRIVEGAIEGFGRKRDGVSISLK